MPPIEPTLFLDLDGVLVDFHRAAYQTFGYTTDSSIETWNFWEVWGMTAEDFWAKLDADWWATLPWTFEGRDFLGVVEQLFGVENIVLLTSPPSINASAALHGKARWIEKNLPRYARQYFLGSPKGHAASPGKVLADDLGANTQKFLAGGGHAVLVPRPWNLRRAELDEWGRFEILSVNANLIEARRRAQEALARGC
jgi:hypothetical protein